MEGTAEDASVDEDVKVMKAIVMNSVVDASVESPSASASASTSDAVVIYACNALLKLVINFLQSLTKSTYPHEVDTKHRKIQNYGTTKI